MNRIKLIIKEKGMYIDIPGLTSFRTPAEVDVTKVKLSLLIQSLHSCGVINYEIVSTDKKGQQSYTGADFQIPEKKQKDDELNNRLDRVETLLLKLVSGGTSQKTNNSEQITNRLNRIEKMIRKGHKITYHEPEVGDSPRIEELDNDRFIPEINVSKMEISGKTTEVVEKKSSKEIDEAVDLLSNLTKNGGK